MYTLRGKQLTKFVRYGTLNLVVQNGFKDDSFHSPPARKGIYAFSLVLQEPFLIGGVYLSQPQHFKKMKDAVDYDYVHNRMREIRRVFEKKEGTVWHHLLEYTKPTEIIQENKCWVKTSISDWQKIVGRTSINDRMPDCRSGIRNYSFNQSHGLSGNHSKDHYEVFFDEKI